jgi:chromosome segregation ATPase
VDEVAKLPELVAAARGLIPEARASFERVSSTYAKDSWQSVAGNGTEAEKRFSTADDLIAHAQKAVSLDSQQWDKANDLLQQVHSVVNDGQSLLAAITERESHLAKAKETAQAEIDAAQRDIDKAAEYEHQFDADIRDSLRDDIGKARELLVRARAELAEAMPNYLRVVDLALQANKAADTAYAEGASEHEAAERLRQQAVSSVQLAEASVSKADQFIRNHSDDVGNSARKHLKSAEELLASAQQTKALEDVVSNASEALDEARSAFKKAENDFNDAESAREAERERIREEERRRQRKLDDARRAEQRRRDESNSTIVVGGGWGSNSGSGNHGGSGSSTNFGGFSGSGGGSGSSTSW